MKMIFLLDLVPLASFKQHQMSGGFVPSVNVDGTLKYDTKPFHPQENASKEDQDEEMQAQEQETESGAHPLNGPVRLSSKQEARLRAYLDDKLMEISRGWKKRYTPESQLANLPAFLAAHRSLLSIITSIPPISSSSTSLLTSYLLRVTSDLAEGICGYSISQSPSLRLSQTLILLDLLDKSWAALSNGRMLHFKIAESSSYKTEEKRIGSKIPSLDGTSRSMQNDDDDEEEEEGFDYGYRSGSLDPFANSGRSMSSTPAPFNRNGTQIQSESFSIPSRGTSTLGQTDKVRLRNLLVTSKENLFVWMRKVLDLPKPPQLLGSNAGEEAEELFGWKNGDVVGEVEIQNLPREVLEEEREDKQKLEREELTTKEGREEDEEMEEDMEEVVIDDQPRPQQENGKDEASDFGNSKWDEAETDEQRQEHEHYRKLFDRKLDPDASESEEEDEKPQIEKLGLQIKSSSTSAQPLSFINSRSKDGLESSTLPISSKTTGPSSATNQKKRKLSSINDDPSLPKLNTNSKTQNSSILSKLNQMSVEKQNRNEKMDMNTELPYEGAPSRNPQKHRNEKGVEVEVESKDKDQTQESEEEMDGNESEATFSGSMASSNNVLLWDLTFARLFSRTLKNLAEQ